MKKRLVEFLVRRSHRGGAAAAWLLRVLYRPERRLAVYGSLAPGRPNHGRLAHLHGRWSEGTVHGFLEDRGWGAALGYPALRWDPEGNPVEVAVLTSSELPRHWRRLDEFEGAEYVRRVVPVYRNGRLALLANGYFVS